MSSVMDMILAQQAPQDEDEQQLAEVRREFGFDTSEYPAGRRAGGIANYATVSEMARLRRRVIGADGPRDDADRAAYFFDAVLYGRSLAIGAEHKSLSELQHRLHDSHRLISLYEQYGGPSRGRDKLLNSAETVGRYLREAEALPPERQLPPNISYLPTRERLKLIGRRHGYPECCTDYFSDYVASAKTREGNALFRKMQELKHELRQEHVPCPTCYAKHEREQGGTGGGDAKRARRDEPVE